MHQLQLIVCASSESSTRNIEVARRARQRQNLHATAPRLWGSVELAVPMLDEAGGDVTRGAERAHNIDLPVAPMAQPQFPGGADFREPARAALGVARTAER